jgi:predicted Zn finger-like uncharacterized protein
MNIECPNCHAAYDVPDSRLGARRTVRCGACGHAWPADHAAPAPAGAVPPESPPESSEEPRAPTPAVAGDRVAADRLAPPRPDPAPRDALLTGAWVASALLMIGMATAAYAWRGDIARAWPPAGHILGTPAAIAMIAQSAPPGMAEVPIAAGRLNPTAGGRLNPSVAGRQ